MSKRVKEALKFQEERFDGIMAEAVAEAAGVGKAPIDELLDFIGYKHPEQTEGGLTVRSLEEIQKEVERCFKKMGFPMLNDEKPQKPKPL